MTRIAKLLSWILSPLLIPTYAMFIAMWLSPLAALPTAIKWEVVIATSIITCGLPIVAIVTLYLLKVISSPGLNNRKERHVPYVLTIMCYLACAWYLFAIHSPQWMWMFMVAGAATAIVSCVVNIWWKISAHSAAMGGLIAMLFHLATYDLAIVPMWPLIVVAIILAGALGTSRILLNHHTFWQVAAGTANGLILVCLLTL
jgi:membrane-associated phospholipid phosphatase